MDQLRIYYEALEQARHFVAPIAKSATKISGEPTFVEISKITNETVLAHSLARGLSLRNPDAIVVVVRDSVEIPLAWLEFTTQVETADHSMQGFNSLGAAGEANIPVVKIVARRVSTSEHGGRASFDEKNLYRVLWRKYKVPSVQLEWPLSPDRTRAIRDSSYLACPPSDLGLREFLKVAYAGVCDGLTASEAIINFAKSRSSALAKDIADNMGPVAPWVERQRSTRFKKRPDGRWELKFNRWGHSMDPERGMAEYLSTLFEEKLVGRIKDPNSKSVSEALEELRKATGMDIPRNKLVAGVIEDASKFIKNSNLNRAGLVIAWFCDEFVIADNNNKEIVRLKWSLEKPDGLKSNIKTASQTLLVKKQQVTEDDITYVAANQTFKINGFDVLSVSYPGAQGDLALLTGVGRTAKRKYFDLIAIKHVDGVGIVAITEAKGTSQGSIIAKDISVVLEWRDTAEKHRKITEALGVKKDSKVLAAVAYPGNRPVSAKGASELDFVILVNEHNWTVWAPLNQPVPGMKIASGSSNLPERFKY